MNNYQDYVIKDGQFIGKFEEMYRDCEDPWNASTEAYESSPCSVTVKQLLQDLPPPVSLISIGSGTGRHLEWVRPYHANADDYGDGVECSAVAVARSIAQYEWNTIYTSDALTFMHDHRTLYTVYLFREVLWYILPDWAEIVALLKAYHRGAMVIVELSFYDDQQYGREYFDGPDDFIAKWPFGIGKIVREHTTKQQRQGRVMIAGRVD